MNFKGLNKSGRIYLLKYFPDDFAQFSCLDVGANSNTYIYRYLSTHRSEINSTCIIIKH